MVALAQSGQGGKTADHRYDDGLEQHVGPDVPRTPWRRLPGVEIIDRSSVNAFDDERVARAHRSTGRKKLIFAGISWKSCAADAAITAVGKGLHAHVAVDASGNLQRDRSVGSGSYALAGRRHSLGLRTTLMVEILKDNLRDRRPARSTVPWTQQASS